MARLIVKKHEPHDDIPVTEPVAEIPVSEPAPEKPPTPLQERDGTMLTVLDWLNKAVEQGASDIFIGVGRSVAFKRNGVITPQSDERLNYDQAEFLVNGLYELAGRTMSKFDQTGDDDFPITVPGLSRFRVNTYRQRGSKAAIIRIVTFGIPDPKDMMIPDDVMGVADELNGLVLITGPAGSGKTTTLACIIDAVNKTRNCHIVTLEDPIEYLHRDNLSLISQREIMTDTDSYVHALRASLRQAPNIILLGEMRDHETIRTAMTAAETGHLVISTLHTVGAANTIDRIIDSFPEGQQPQIRMQLSGILRMVVTQRLLPNKNGESIPAFEIMKVNNAISNVIRDAKTHQIDNIIQTSAQDGMIGMDAFIMKLFRAGEITAETALANASNPDTMHKQLALFR